ncbi:MAG: hypothetical protein CL559_16195 [Alphaproteobacteria bacterium]|nr:hypothetical protein [Alphaproteobacteria bacterium]
MSMKRTIGAAAIASSLLAGTAITMVPGTAQACGCLPPAYASTVATSTGAIGAGFGMLTLMISQSFGALNASLSAQASSNAEVVTQQNSEYPQRARYEARHEILNGFTYTHDPCISYDATTRSGPKSLGSLQIRRQLSEANDMQLRNMTTDTAGSATANARARTENMEEKYCGELPARLGRCDPAASDMDLGSRPELRDGHIKPLVFTQDTLDEKLSVATNDFAYTLMGPTPPAHSASVYNSPRGAMRMAERTTRDARIDTSMETWEYLIGLKAEVGEEDKELADNLRKHLTGSDDAELNGSNEHATRMSLYELMALQNEYRFKDGTWVEGMITAPDELGLLKELTIMEATGLYTDWMRFELDQRIAGNLAIIVAAKADEAYERAQ